MTRWNLSNCILAAVFFIDALKIVGALGNVINGTHRLVGRSIVVLLA